MRLHIRPQLLTGAVLLQELRGPASGVCPGAPHSLLHPNIWQHLLSKVADPCQGCRASLRTSLGRGETAPPRHPSALLGWGRREDSGEAPSKESHVLEERMVSGGKHRDYAAEGSGANTLILAGKFLGEDDLQESHPTSPFCPKIIDPWPGGVPALKVFRDSKCPGDVFFPS